MAAYAPMIDQDTGSGFKCSRVGTSQVEGKDRLPPATRGERGTCEQYIKEAKNAIK
jgi:hypothetical protein